MSDEDTIIDTVKNNKRVVVGISIVILLLIGSIVFISTDETVEPDDWVAFNEDQEQYYDSINTAVEETNEGDTVIISQGEYSETFSVATDGVTIKGEEIENGQYDTTFNYEDVDFEYSEDRRTLNQMVYDNPEIVETENVAPFEVSGDNVTIQNIHLEGEVESYSTDGYAVFVGGDNATLSITTNNSNRLIIGAIKSENLTITDSYIRSNVIIYESDGIQIEDSEFGNTNRGQMDFIIAATNDVTLTGNKFDLYDEQINTRLHLQPNVPNRELDNVVQEINFDTYTFTNNEFNIDHIVLCSQTNPNVNPPTDCQGQVNVDNNTSDRGITISAPSNNFPSDNNYWNP